MTYLFLCSIGPVQEFIATARRSRDLQYGSWMLSELAKAGAKAIAEKYGPESLIFPAPESISDLEPNTKLNVANKILAGIEGDPSEAGKIFQEAVYQRLDELREKAFAHIQDELFDRDLAERQISDLPELYWVSVPYENEDQYVKARRAAESFLAARKNTRNFHQFPGKTVPKSSLDASRESVIHESAYPNSREDDEKVQRKISRLYRIYGARRGERLSGVDLLKRQGSQEIAFPSTSAIASQPFLQGLGKQSSDNLLNALEAWLSERQIEVEKKSGVWLYPGRMAEYLSDLEAQEYTQALERALELFANGQHPGIHYALLVADGDGMGEILNDMKTPGKHREFSKLLSTFAVRAKDIIFRHKGTPIYIGGDDIMAYLPLHTALDCLRELDQAFRETLNGASTLSGGLMIAHHLHPLSDVLNMARSAEKEAKSVKGKNALCVVLNKRSGAVRTIRGKWEEINTRLTVLANYYRHKVISTGTAYELQKVSRTLKEVELPSNDIKNALAQEAIRIIKRKKESGGGADLPEAVSKQLSDWLEKDSIDVEELALEMIIATEFAKAQDLAKLPLPALENALTEANL